MAAQRSLNTVGHNIANVNTEGYSRQRVEQTEQDPSASTLGFLGNGVNPTSVTRAYDTYLDTQVRTSQSAYTGLDTYHQLAAQIDTVIGHADTSLSGPLQSFFGAVQGVTTDPSSIPARQVLLVDGQSLGQRFASLDGKFNDLRDQTNQTLTADVGHINDLASGIADLNTQIVTALGQTNGQPPNDLLDQRDQLVEQLAQKVDAQAIPQKDGSVSVFIGNGQGLVLNGTAGTLKLQASAYDPNTQDITLSLGGNPPTTLTQTLSGGEVGGLLKFRQEVLDPAQNNLGRIAAGLAVAVNTQHRAGTDLNGAAGQDFFTAPSATWYGKQTNTGSAQLAVAFDNTAASATVPANGPAQLTGSDYRLDYDSAGNASLTRLSDNTRFSDNPAGSGSFQVDGLKIGTASGTPSPNDSFLIQPFRPAASGLNVALTDPKQIAAAGPAPTGPGDNSNARALAGLQTATTLQGGKASFQTAYSQIVGDIGAKTQAADTASTAQKKLLDQATQSREAISGVNLDEEAASLVRFQQAYQASAQLIPVLNNVFNALIGAVRG